MEQEKILNKVDHTLLAQTATWEEIRQICDDGIKYHTASVCIPPAFVKQASEYVKGQLRICTVIGFPNGYQTRAVKEYETKDALENGADEIDMVIHIGDVKEKKYDAIREEITALKKICGEHILKVIIETCLLTTQEKIEMCRVVSEAGADYIKTSTGFSTAGATFEDVELFQKYVNENVKIKAAGGISSFEDAEHFVSLGADRLGTSRLIKIRKEQEKRPNESIASAENTAEEGLQEMIREAVHARKNAYTPYSHFKVGACLETANGRRFKGCNIENASYGVTNCAERTAFFQAIAQGEHDFKRIVIVGGKENEPLEWCPPCGVCRQVMEEFCENDTFEIILAVSENEYKKYTLKQLLPLGFGKEMVHADENV